MIQTSSITGRGASAFDLCYATIQKSFFECRTEHEDVLIHIKFESPTMLRPQQEEGRWTKRNKKKSGQIWYWVRVPDESVKWPDNTSIDFIFDWADRVIRDAISTLQKWGVSVTADQLFEYRDRVHSRALELLQQPNGST